MTLHNKHYSTYRDLMIATNNWQPWTGDVEKVRKHIAVLRSTGATWRAIARAAGLGDMTIWQMANNTGQRIKTRTANAVLAVRPEDVIIARVPAGGARWRIRSLVAMGHWYSRQAAIMGVDHEQITQLANREPLQKTTSAELDAKIHKLWLELWDKRPVLNTASDKAAYVKALRMAKEKKWPTPANLDESLIYDPDYWPAGGWHPATGIGAA